MAGLTPKPARRRLHQGAILDRVPIIWVDRSLWLVRPKNAARLDEAVLVPATSVTDAFSGDRGEETIVAMAKARPAIVISPAPELRRSDTFRVAPVYSYNPGSFWERHRADVIAGSIPYAVHLNRGQGLHEGVVRLDQVAVVPAGIGGQTGTRHVGALDAADVAVLLDHYGRYVTLLDIAETGQRP